MKKILLVILVTCVFLSACSNAIDENSKSSDELNEKITNDESYDKELDIDEVQEVEAIEEVDNDKDTESYEQQEDLEFIEGETATEETEDNSNSEEVIEINDDSSDSASSEEAVDSFTYIEADGQGNAYVVMGDDMADALGLPYGSTLSIDDPQFLETTNFNGYYYSYQKGIMYADGCAFSVDLPSDLYLDVNAANYYGLCAFLRPHYDYNAETYWYVMMYRKPEDDAEYTSLEAYLESDRQYMEENFPGVTFNIVEELSIKTGESAIIYEYSNIPGGTKEYLAVIDLPDFTAMMMMTSVYIEEYEILTTYFKPMIENAEYLGYIDMEALQKYHEENSIY